MAKSIVLKVMIITLYSNGFLTGYDLGAKNLRYLLEPPENDSQRQPKELRLGLDLPPSPPSLPIIGHLHLVLSRLIHKSLQKISSKYGPLLHLRIFHIPVVLVSSASVAYEIFKKQDVNVSSRGIPTSDEYIFFGSSSFATAPYGDYWRFMKKLIVTKVLGHQALERSRSIRADEIRQFYSNLLDKAMKKESVKIVEEVMKLINNSICKILMGKSFPNEKSKRVRGLVKETDALTLKIMLAFVFRRPLEKLGISLFKKEFMGASSRFDEMLENTLVEHEEKTEEKGMDLMDILLEAYGDENAEYKITRNHMKSLFVELLVASSDTTSHAIEWTMAEVINNPKVLEGLRGEIYSVVGNTRLIQETDLPNLPYLQAVVKEALRLHPPGPIFPREFKQGCNIGGYYVPEKTSLVINAYAIMRDPDFWEDPEEFKPERFLPSSKLEEQEEENVLKFIPFGSGRRSCPGSNLAYILSGMVIGVMVQCFDWRIKEGRVNMDEAAGAGILSMAHPLNCTPITRSVIGYA